jgi:alkanesulfonate monooxygenase SsuD/methylene tetrahydromethanopterin reductase-like flavin-dependent oxidoreductase (luciferase family)
VNRSGSWLIASAKLTAKGGVPAKLSGGGWVRASLLATEQQLQTAMAEGDIKMKFGVFDHVDCSANSIGEHLENRLRLTEVYDRCGIHGYHIAEHHGTPLGYSPSPAILLSAVAQRTKRIKLGPLVFLLPLYSPLRLVEEIVMLDQMSGGRLMLGIGRGVSPIELAFYGVDIKESQAIYDEARECVFRGLHNEHLNFSGKYFQFKDVPMMGKTVQQPHPELWYGVFSPESTVWAAANDVNVVTLALADGTRAITDRYKAEWAALGKPLENIPLMGVSRHIVVADTDAEARELARSAYTHWVDSFSKLWHDAGMDVPLVGTIYPHDWDDLQAIGNGCAGSPETVRKYVQEEAEKSGFNYFVSWLAFGNLDVNKASRSAELFGEHVIKSFPSEKQGTSLQMAG